MSDRSGSMDQADPRQALRVLIERGEGSSASATMLRLLWLRQDHPSATVTTEPVYLTDTSIVVRAAITVQGGPGGSGLAAANVEDRDLWAESVERAETDAISRALDTLGYVLERAGEDTAPQSVRTSPTPVPPQGGPRSMPPAQPRPTPIQRTEESAPPVVNALRRAQSRPQAVPPPAEPPKEDDAHLPEYSWTEFWNTARGHGLDAKRIEEILGRPAHQSSPKEAVEALQAAGAWGPPRGEG